MTREKLEALWKLCKPKAESADAQLELRNFHALLDIGTDEAFLAAAMMCRPQSVNHWPQYTWISTNPNNPVQKERVEIWTKGCRKPFRGEGPTPAEALIEAIEKAMNDE